MRADRTQQGFTLAELAIVIVIIGLLVGGALAGKELVDSARIKTIIKTVGAMQMALETFKSKYNALPGDFATATLNLPGCTATEHCANGNGDMIIGAVSTNYTLNDQAGTTALPAGETTQFWKHLALGGMISGINTSANPSEPQWGATHPECPGCGGYDVVHIRSASAELGSPRVGPYVIIRPFITGTPNPATEGSGSMSPLWAFEVDQKMDDGNAGSGYALAPQSDGRCADTSGIYNTTTNLENCIMIMSLDP